MTTTSKIEAAAILVSGLAMYAFAMAGCMGWL